jgi:hypothetical protein
LVKPNLIGITNNKAKAKFDSGPAKDTKAIPLFGLRKLLKFTGTGLAAPKIIGE